MDVEPQGRWDLVDVEPQGRWDLVDVEPQGRWDLVDVEPQGRWDLEPQHFLQRCRIRTGVAFQEESGPRPRQAKHGPP